MRKNKERMMKICVMSGGDKKGLTKLDMEG